MTVPDLRLGLVPGKERKRAKRGCSLAREGKKQKGRQGPRRGKEKPHWQGEFRGMKGERGS